VLAKALKQKIPVIKSMVHRGKKVFASDAFFRAEADESLPAQPTVPTWKEGGPALKAMGGFRVFGEALVLGEHPGSNENEKPPGGLWCLVQPAHNGVWFVWTKEIKEVTYWIAAHESVVQQLEFLFTSAVLLGEVMVHGGTTSAVDAEVRHDREFQKKLEHLEPTNRSFTAALEGDGEAQWHGVMHEGRLIAIVTH
jgi:hypothetical protein